MGSDLNRLVFFIFDADPYILLYYIEVKSYTIHAILFLITAILNNRVLDSFEFVSSKPPSFIDSNCNTITRKFHFSCLLLEFIQHLEYSHYYDKSVLSAFSIIMPIIMTKVFLYILLSRNRTFITYHSMLTYQLLLKPVSKGKMYLLPLGSSSYFSFHFRTMFSLS